MPEILVHFNLWRAYSLKRVLFFMHRGGFWKLSLGESQSPE